MNKKKEPVIAGSHGTLGALKAEYCDGYLVMASAMVSSSAKIL